MDPVSPVRINPAAEDALSNQRLQRNLKGTLKTALHSRAVSVAEVDNWEALREHARQVKAHTLENLGDYLGRLETAVKKNGGQVLWAETSQEANQVIVKLARDRGVRKIIKSKTMLGEEIKLNDALEEASFRPIESDLGEYIVRLGGEPPSHIIAPALHKSKEEISDLFSAKLGTQPTDDPTELTAQARRLLRSEFIEADMGISGVNFAVAENGRLVVVENEGNARLTMSLPRVHVAIMGIEKVIPRMSDLAVFLRLLTRSATGQAITSYVHLFDGGRRAGELDGPTEFFLILVDNGRSRILADGDLRETLACIRCGACQNACPVFQRIGGHAYQTSYQGPIGAILMPQLLTPEQVPDHPFASSLCGACQEVCPVKIEIPRILVRLRERVQKARRSRTARIGIRLWSWIMTSPRRYAIAGAVGRVVLRRGFARAVKIFYPSILRAWTRHRSLPTPAKKSFRQRYKNGI